MKDELINQTFGKLTVIKQVPRPVDRKTQGKYYLCQCSCGKTKIIDKKGLISGRVQSCGCLRAERVSKSITIDITGQRFGRLTVLEKVKYEDTPQRSEAIWLCQCDCGNKIKVRGSAIRSGKTRSCGCLQRDIASKLGIKNEIGNKYGKLEVIKYLGTDERQNAIWLCRCDCGNYKEVRGSYLRSGHVKSCGCLVSAGEQFILEILQKHNIPFISQFSCQSLKTSKNGFYKFDFAITKNTYEPIGLIEYNGRQHYEKTNFFEPLEEIQERDKQKRIWCEERKLPLLILKYDLTDKEIEEKVLNFITQINEDGTIETTSRSTEE